MKRAPDVGEVVQLGQAMGLDLTPAEVEVAHAEVSAIVAGLDIIDEHASLLDKPSVYPADRSRQWRPSPHEDPHRAFITCCTIEGAPDGELAGLRLSVKDAIPVAGVPMTLGARALEGYIPDFDAPIVERALAAGATIVGKNNMEPFSMGVGTAGSRDFGAVTNPWDPARAPGGSSSGSAAAVAAGHADLAFGTDSGGSVRVPAAWCGVVGLKPTRGVLPLTGIVGFEFLHDRVGPLGRDVPTIARFMDAVAGPDGYDLRVPETYVPDMASQLEHGVEGLRIGVLDEGMQAVVEPDVADAVQAAVSTLTAAGATARTVSVPIHHAAMRIAAPLLYEALSLGYFTAFAGQPGVGYVSPTFASAMGKFRAAAASRLPLRVKSFILTGRYLHERYDGAIGARVAALRKPMTDAYDEILSEVDVLAMPTVPMKAPLFQPGATYAEANVLAGTGGGAEFAVVAANTWPFNLTGHPAISVPCATSAGLPIALQLVASRFDDKTLLRAANAFQHAVPWEALVTPPAATQQAGS